MQKRLRSNRLLWLSALLLSGVATSRAHEQGSAPDSADRILAAVDVKLTHRVVERDGSPAWPISTETAFTLQKVRTASGATKITLAYHPTALGNRTRASANPLDGARVEYDTAARTTTVFDQMGRRPNPRLSPAQPSSGGLGSFDAWLDALVFRASDVTSRREALERSHGRPVGNVGRFTRYVQTRGEVTEEMLADPAWGVPVEVNVLRRDVLQGHITIDYATTPAGDLVRRRHRAEELIEATTGRRSMTAVEFSNVIVRGW